MIKLKKFHQLIYLNRRLASLHYKKKTYDKATEKIKEVIEQVVDPLIIYKEIERVVGFESKVKSEIVYLGGEQNIGCITTISENKEFFTKLSIGKNREYYFYKYVYPLYINLYKDDAKFITPFIQHIYLKDVNILAIVMNKINRTNINLKEKLFEVFYINKMYSSVKNKDFFGTFSFKERNQEFILFHPAKMNNPITALHSFSYIYKKEANESLFNQAKKHLKKMNYINSIKYFEKLEELILVNKIYNKIDLMENFSIQHGDFFEHNLIQDENFVYCIDWGCARLSPKVTDIAGLLGRMKLPLNFIENEFLNHKRSDHLTNLDKIIFLYILIITWLIVYERHELEKIASTELNRAIEGIKFRLE